MSRDVDVCLAARDDVSKLCCVHYLTDDYDYYVPFDDYLYDDYLHTDDADDGVIVVAPKHKSKGKAKGKVTVNKTNMKKKKSYKQGGYHPGHKADPKKQKGHKKSYQYSKDDDYHYFRD